MERRQRSFEEMDSVGESRKRQAVCMSLVDWSSGIRQVSWANVKRRMAVVGRMGWPAIEDIL